MLAVAEAQAVILLLIAGLEAFLFAFIIYGPPYPSGLAPWRRSKAKLVIEHKGPYRLRISLTDGGGRGMKVG